MGHRLVLAAIVGCLGWVAGCGGPDNTVEGGMGMDTGVPEGDGSVRDAGVDAARDGAADGHLDVDAMGSDSGPGGLEDGSVFFDGSAASDAEDGGAGIGDGSLGADGGTGGGGDGGLHVDFDAGDAGDASRGTIVDTGLISADPDSSVFLIDGDIVHLADIGVL